MTDIQKLKYDLAMNCALVKALPIILRLIFVDILESFIEVKFFFDIAPAIEFLELFQHV